MQKAPLFHRNPFNYREVDIHADGNEYWNARYGYKIPVLYLYRYHNTANYRQSLNEMEKKFWDDEAWKNGWNRDLNVSWQREERIVIDLETKVTTFRNSGELERWIWKV
jgi:hypothetical protein